MTKFSVKKSELSVEGVFARPAFNLFGAGSDVLDVVTTCLSDFCLVRGADIRIASNTSPLSSAEIIVDLRSLNGFARVSVDNAQIVMFNPQSPDIDKISRIASSYLGAVNELLSPNSYGHYIVNFNFHAAVENVTPADHTRRFVVTPSGTLDSSIGNSVTYYFGQRGLRLHSFIALDMSGEFSDCVFVRTSMGFDAKRVAAVELKDAAIEHCKKLLALVELEADW